MSSDRATLCKGCWQIMRLPIPLRGIASLPFRAFGVRPNRMNPNTCTLCEMLFTTLMKTRQVSIEATVMFADLRGYTAISQSASEDAIGELLDDFYDGCAEAIWQHDGLLNKTMGDAVMAVFNFPIKHADHAEQAVMAAREIQERCKTLRSALATVDATLEIGAGVGIDSGRVRFGEFGRSHQDFTAIGTVVNLAARAQSVALVGEILVTKSVEEKLSERLPPSAAREYKLKGFGEPQQLWMA